MRMKKMGPGDLDLRWPVFILFFQNNVVVAPKENEGSRVNHLDNQR